MNGKTLKRNSDLWKELEQIGYFSGQMPEGIDDLPDDVFASLHEYLEEEEDTVEDIPQEQ